jgi:hypothetical protein
MKIEIFYMKEIQIVLRNGIVIKQILASCFLMNGLGLKRHIFSSLL